MAKEENFEEKMMDRCLALARHGEGQVAPNPMVGCVITIGHRVIGEGFHRKLGEAHAEVNAIASVSPSEELRQATLFVNLEPCSHTGKTPPCADLIIRKGIPKVVVAVADPNPKVSGAGIQRLRNAGIEVSVGIREQESISLNERFFCFFQKRRPWVLLKWAQSLDGYIDIIRNDYFDEPAPWITNPLAKTYVHKWRTEEQAILVGTGTLKKDNPRLTVREWIGNHPLRVIVDPSGDLDLGLKVFDEEAPTLVFGYQARNYPKGTECVILPRNHEIIPSILEELWTRNILSIMVEGGEKVLKDFIRLGVWDEARVFVGNKWFYEGVKAPSFPKPNQKGTSIKGNDEKSFSRLIHTSRIGDSSLLLFKPLP
jgi:diaminohydroxyphosphoribosylaminopyrimidine deaminase/5-amino-6-(5-phosphoribosylamino)uracil reductase